MYYTIKFTKALASGFLAGLDYPETMMNCSVGYLEWLRKSEASQELVDPCAGSTQYRVRDVVITREYDTPAFHNVREVYDVS